MRQPTLFTLLALTLSLGACASGPPMGASGRVSSFEPRQEFAATKHRKSLRRVRVFHHRASQQAAILLKSPKEETPEPRPTSTEWWTRENTRLGKAIIICRGCFAAATANASLPKPAVLSSKPDLSAIPTGSLNRLEGSIGVETRDQP
jgi:hypothetical protein